MKPVINMWRQFYEYDHQSLNTAFVAACQGSRALDTADPASTLLVWLHNGHRREERVAFVGATLGKGRSNKVHCVVHRLYVTPPPGSNVLVQLH